MKQKDKSFLKQEEKLLEWILGLVRSDFAFLGGTLIKGLRFAWRRRPGPVERSSRAAATFPHGPFAMERKRQAGDLLLWVPQHVESFLINDLTGRFGYSHTTVDTGEVDLPTGKPVMVEVTIGQVVERKFQDEYAGRPFVRVPLSKTGVDVQAFVACVLSKLGEPYSNLEALTLGEIDDPAKQVCSSLAAECLPETQRQAIARARRLGALHRMSVSVHSHPRAPETKVFISPNGFAQYYGAPKGEKVRGTNIMVNPRPVKPSARGANGRRWKTLLILGAAAGLAAGMLLILQHSQEKRMKTKDRRLTLKAKKLTANS